MAVVYKGEKKEKNRAIQAAALTTAIISLCLCVYVVCVEKKHLVTVLAISVEYRVASEHPLPTAYEDSWTALQWVSSHKVRNNINPESRGVCPIIGSSNPVIYHEFRWELQLSGASATNIEHLKGSFLNQEPWLLDHADFERLFIGGDTTGANIVHNITLCAGIENLHGNTKKLGAFLCQPYFWGSKPIRSESSLGHQDNMICRTGQGLFWFMDGMQKGQTLMVYYRDEGSIQMVSVSPSHNSAVFDQ
ncbi:hypothetical protein RJ639_015612 [Escallonia herrerae]|uniref:Alpha/beta hydrolase fold-3 domain-containing protein n=1 Tax=Escallonia herrerae TaxID=1293975 RepID=A0AA88VEN4_9ASTE|nr:hypothetical protein RJ639_015612 [Escallonia herrerae]